MGGLTEHRGAHNGETGAMKTFHAGTVTHGNTKTVGRGAGRCPPTKRESQTNTRATSSRETRLSSLQGKKVAQGKTTLEEMPQEGRDEKRYTKKVGQRRGKKAYTQGRREGGKRPVVTTLGDC